MGEPKGRGMSGLHAVEAKREGQNPYHVTWLTICPDTGDEFTKQSSSVRRKMQLFSK